jgi:TPR repeat protein
MLIQGEGGPKRPAQGRRYLDCAAALGQIDALKVLAYALSHGEYSYRTSHTLAKASGGRFGRLFRALANTRPANPRAGDEPRGWIDRS